MHSLRPSYRSPLAHELPIVVANGRSVSYPTGLQAWFREFAVTIQDELVRPESLDRFSSYYSPQPGDPGGIEYGDWQLSEDDLDSAWQSFLGDIREMVRDCENLDQVREVLSDADIFFDIAQDNLSPESIDAEAVR
jgi:hypothetical protein